jgi:nucleoside permease NupC
MHTVQSIVGIFGLLALTFVVSENRRAVSFRQAAIGLGLTVVLAVLFLVEAPLCIKPYLVRLTRSELFVVMTCGMAGIATTWYRSDSNRSCRARCRRA